MVSLYNRDHPRDTMMFCVGTLISSKYIVSSAQCVYDALKLRFSPAERISVNTTLGHFKMGLSPQFRSSCLTQEEKKELSG